MLDFLPKSIESQLKNQFGTPENVEPLSGLTNAKVWRIQFANNSAIVKQTDEANELFFYEHIGSVLRNYDIATPHLYGLKRDSSVNWIVIEDIPIPFVRDRWLADTEQLHYLRHLHGINGEEWRTAPTLYQPQWTNKMTASALSWFSDDVVNEIGPILASWSQASQPLFEPQCLISGDPNPTNWGCRTDGTLVQFDWARFGWGMPALDLAITVPGLGKTGDFAAVAACYLGNTEQSQVERLTNRIKLAKAWTIVELLCNIAPDEDKFAQVIPTLKKEFPAWIQHLSSVKNA